MSANIVFVWIVSAAATLLWVVQMLERRRDRRRAIAAFDAFVVETFAAIDWDTFEGKIVDAKIADAVIVDAKIGDFLSE